MDVFNNNRRLEDNIMYSLEWAKFLRHNIDDILLPFLFEWKEDKLFMNMLQPDGDPEDFAYKIAENSKRESDQFVLGYEGFLQDQNGNKQKAFIIKGYDKTQSKGVFLAQLFLGKETDGNFKLIDSPIFISNPDLPFPIKENLLPSYDSTDVSYTGVSLKDGGHMSIMTHDNPAVLANGIKRILRNKLSTNESSDINGEFQFSVAPINNIDFLKYALTQAINTEKENETIKKWESENKKTVKITLTIGDEEIVNELTQAEQESSTLRDGVVDEKQTKPTTEEPDKTLESKYRGFTDEEIFAEFNRIINIPNARTNIQCLEEVSALMKISKERGIDLKDQNMPKKKEKKGCVPVIVACLILVGSLVFYWLK